MLVLFYLSQRERRVCCNTAKAFFCLWLLQQYGTTLKFSVWEKRVRESNETQVDLPALRKLSSKASHDGAAIGLGLTAGLVCIEKKKKKKKFTWVRDEKFLWMKIVAFKAAFCSILFHGWLEQNRHDHVFLCQMKYLRFVCAVAVNDTIFTRIYTVEENGNVEGVTLFPLFLTENKARLQI